MVRLRKGMLAVVLVGVVLAGAQVALAHGNGDDASRPCNTIERECLIEVANTYMNAQAGGLGTREEMRLARDVHRWENGILNATTAEQLRAGSPGAPSQIWSQRDRDRVWVDGNQVFSIWIVDIRDANTQQFTNTVHIFERLQVDIQNCDGAAPCVNEVEAVFCISPQPFAPAKPETTPNPRPSGLCTRAG
jgi:hypothetical protein